MNLAYIFQENLMYTCMCMRMDMMENIRLSVDKQHYSGTSDNGLSLLRTQCKKLYIKDKISCPKLYF